MDANDGWYAMDTMRLDRWNKMMVIYVLAQSGIDDFLDNL